MEHLLATHSLALLPQRCLIVIYLFDSGLEPLFLDCLLPGTLVRFHGGSNPKWQDVDDLDSAEEDSADEEQSLKVEDDGPLSSECTFHSIIYGSFFQTFGSEGLQLVDHAEIVLSGQAVLQLTFDPGAFGRTLVTTRCQLDHPFYVKNKGDEHTVPNMVQTHLPVFFFSPRLVVVLPQPDCGASWDPVLRHGGWRHVSPSGTPRR